MATPTSFAVFRQVFLALAVVHGLSFILPVFASVVGISFAIVVHDEIVSIQSISHDLFVSFVVDGLVYGLGFLHFVVVKRGPASLSKSAQLRQAICSRGCHCPKLLDVRKLMSAVAVQKEV